jgi:hypothetical protein
MWDSLEDKSNVQLALYATAQQEAKHLTVAVFAFLVYDMSEYFFPVRIASLPYPSHYL